MEQVDLEQYGFIKSVNLCIQLLQEFGDKITPELLKQYIGEETKIYMDSQEFIGLVVEAVQSGGQSFLDKMMELYEIKDEILAIIEPESLISIIEKQTQKSSEEILMQDEYIDKLASFVLAQDRFRDYLYAYTKKEVADAIAKMDLDLIVTDLVKENADKYAQLLLESTKQKELQAEAALFVILEIEKICFGLHRDVLIFDPDYIHPQEIDGAELPNKKLKGGIKDVPATENSDQ